MVIALVSPVEAIWILGLLVAIAVAVVFMAVFSQRERRYQSSLGISHPITSDASSTPPAPVTGAGVDGAISPASTSSGAGTQPPGVGAGCGRVVGASLPGDAPTLNERSR